MKQQTLYRSSENKKFSLTKAQKVDSFVQKMKLRAEKQKKEAQSKDA